MVAMGIERTRAERRYTWKVTGSSFLGNTLEYYDFLVYGTAAAVVFPKVFFPGASGFVATLAAFGTFAVGFLARPVGGFVFGRLGDTWGRKPTLMITLTVMGGSTVLMGLLPAYSTIGVWAPVLLVLLRLLQGFAVGGEWGGAMIIVLESAPARRRGFYSALPNTGGFSAQILITMAFAWVYTLSEEDMLSWGWRVPFLLSAVLVVLTFWMRRTLHETPVFTEAVAGSAATTGTSPVGTVPGGSTYATRPASVERTGGAPVRGPIRSLLIDDWRNLLLIVGLRFAEALPYFLLTVFALSYGKSALGIERSTLNNAILIVSVLALLAQAAFAAISDRVGRRPVYMFGTVVVFLSAFPFFWLLNTGSFLLILLGYILMLNVGHNAINAVQPAFFAELFPADRRYTGAAGGREIASVLAGGITPFVATALAGEDGTGWPLVAGYVMVGALITMVAVWLAPETYRRDLSRTATPAPSHG